MRRVVIHLAVAVGEIFGGIDAIFRTPSSWTSSAWFSPSFWSPQWPMVRNNNNDTTGEAPFKQARSLHPTLGELNHALSQVGGPTQSQLSRPMSAEHHISMEHRLRWKHPWLNSDTDASNEMCLKKYKKKKRTNMFQEKTKLKKKLGT